MSQIQVIKFIKQSGFVYRFLIYYGQLLKEFLQSTVLNGLKYLTFKCLTLWERLFVFCCLLAIFYNSFYLAITVFEKWKASPVITMMNPKPNSITNDPFPAVAVCNMNQVQYSKVKDIKINSLQYAMLNKACFADFNFKAYSHFEQPSENDNLLNFFIKHAQNCSDLIKKCYYGNKERTCSDLFREIILDEGLCCSFNSVHPYLLYKGEYNFIRDYTSKDGLLMPLDWNPDKGYPKDLPEEFYPRPPVRGGKTNGLTIILNGDVENYYCSSTLGYGFKISTHNPIDTPNVYEAGLTVQLGVETSFRLTPYKEESNENLRSSTTPQERQCYFSDEYSLIYHRYYTKRNCEVECAAKFLLKKCNCLAFYMPQIYPNASRCHVKHFNCYSEVEKDLTDQEYLACKKVCLPTCTELTTQTKGFITLLENTGFAVKNPFFRNMTSLNLKKHAIVNLYFQENYYRGNIKNDYIRFTEFASQVGGILALMMGFSVISLVEIIYFFILKPFINLLY